MYIYIYTYRRKEFQNILKRKLCSCFGQLFGNTYLLKKFEHGIKHHIDSD